MLQEADIVFWIGEDLESFLETPLDSIAASAKRVTLMDSDQIELLKFREKKFGKIGIISCIFCNSTL